MMFDVVVNTQASAYVNMATLAISSMPAMIREFLGRLSTCAMGSKKPRPHQLVTGA